MDINDIKQIFKNSEIVGEKITIQSDIIKTLKFIKENYAFDMLKEITAIDCQEQGIELLYRLYSIDNEEEMTISIMVKDVIESISGIFDSAIADEKEIYDLFGVKFIGNKELERLYMPESWQGHPLKKDYEEKDERLTWNE